MVVHQQGRSRDALLLNSHLCIFSMDPFFNLETAFYDFLHEAQKYKDSSKLSNGIWHVFVCQHECSRYAILLNSHLRVFSFDPFFDLKKEFYDFDYEAQKYRESSKLSNGTSTGTL